MSLTFKILVCGPKGVGKSTICNGLCDYNTPLPSEYRTTKGVRILETEQTFSEDQIKANENLKAMTSKKCNIQLWDLGGDKINEKLWPSIKHEAAGAILVIDAKNNKHDNIIDEWINGFCLPNIEIDNMICIAYNKDTQKSDKQRTSNQFPKLTIFETNYDINNLFPILHQFVDKLIAKLK